MKEFDLELAKAGHPVCTRDGKPVRIICFDVKGTNYPIVAVVKEDVDVENVKQYTNRGEYYVDGCTHPSDLKMAYEVEESDDEKIRNFIANELACLRATDEKGSDRYEELTNALAWLEKQGEKSVDKLKVSDELYEHIRNTCACIDDALSSETLVDVTDYLSMAEHSAQSAFDMIEKQGEQKLIIEGTFVNVDEVRENFMQEVYRILNADQTNDRANQIIEVFDNLPTVELEKQGEQKLTDKVEPKFKVGDWIVKNDGKDCFSDGSYVLQITGIDCNKYNLSNGCYLIEPFTNTYRLWTIQDAKDGDVLADGYNNIGIYNATNGDFWNSYIYLGCDNHLYGFGGYHYLKNTKPATKEQRDLLFQKMHEAGYEWDAERKELSKIEDKPVAIIPKFKVGDIIRHKKHGFTCKIIAVDTEYRLSECSGTHLPFDFQDSYELVEQNPAWSDEDENAIKVLMNIIKKSEIIDPLIYTDLLKEKLYDFLKSIKDRFQQQNK